MKFYGVALAVLAALALSAPASAILRADIKPDGAGRDHRPFEVRPAIAQADPPARSSYGNAEGRVVREHDRALDAYKAGRIVPFSRVRKMIMKEYNGRVIDADLDRSSQPWFYNVRTLTESGRVIIVRVNASNGRVVSVTGRP